MHNLSGKSLSLGLVCIFSLWLTACQVLFGEYKASQKAGDAGVAIEVSQSAHAGANSMITSGGGGLAVADNGGSAGSSGSPGQAGASETAAGTACSSDGIYRCTGTTLEICQDQKWQPGSACTKELCDVERGRCMSCAPGTRRCVAWSLQTCAATGDSWTVVADCNAAEYCDAVSGSCYACVIGETFCSGARLYACKKDQTGWDVTDCQDANLCNARSGSCRACVDDETQCNAASLQRCNVTGDWEQTDLCNSPEICQASLAARASDPTNWTGKCQQPRCKAGEYRCNPNNPAELQGCPPSGLDWNLIDTCLTPALCNATARGCDPGCVPGTYLCADARLQLCKKDGTGYDLINTCQDVDHCNTESRDCVPCVAGESQCSGGTLQICGANLTWKTQQVCASTALCDATNAQCVPAGCPKAGAFHCDGADLQLCPPNLVGWAPKATCVTPTLCDAANGRCNSPQCPVPGEFRCQGNVREQCEATTRTWKAINTCAAGQVCDLTSATGCLGSCPPIATRCNTTGTQADVEHCTVLNNVPEWQYVTTCATSALCVVADPGATCNAPACTVDQYQCSGATLQHCNSGRTGWDSIKTCNAGQFCDSAAAQCDNCVADSYECRAGNLYQCSSNGQASAVVENCGSDARCYTSGDKRAGYCYRCDSGNAQCVGTDQLQNCATNRRDWDAPKPCANGCQNNAGNSDYCADCGHAGEIQCVQSAPPGSTRTCPQDRSAWGQNNICSAGYGCVDDGFSDYCASACTPNASICVSATGLHTCAKDGQSWGATLSQCANSGSQRACINGTFSSAIACPAVTPACVLGKCFACTGTTTECADATTARRCNSGSWISTACSGDTPVCSGGACVACTVNSRPTCVDNATRQFCSGTTWAKHTCSGATQYCQDGSCVACTSANAASCIDTKTVQFCSGSTWTTAVCAPPNPSCFGGTCKPCNSDTTPDCLDATTRRYCNGGALATESCNIPGSTACLLGACVGCNASSAPKCSSTNTLSTCNASGAWVDTVCPVATPVCAGAPGKCVQCAPDSTWVCSNTTTRHSCSGNLSNDQSCATGQICDPADASCKAPLCAAGEYFCVGQKLQSCNASRTDWDNVTTCAGKTPACSAIAKSCVGCASNIDCASGATCQTDGSCQVLE